VAAVPSPAATSKPEPASPSPESASPAAAVIPGAGEGSLRRGDFLSTLLNRKELPWHAALLGLGAAFLLGAMHALSPGHGKTLVAAYLVGSRGTLGHAGFLGATVTFTHTVSVFLLGLATLFLSRYILPEKIVPWMGAISGLSIIFLGFSLFRRRLAKLLGWKSSAGEAHVHYHGGFAHSHSPGEEHDHGDGPHTHHVPEEMSLPGQIALGVSGGLVPCPTALVLLLSAIALGRTAYGLMLLVSFSFGLALVLMAIGAAVLYAKTLLPASPRIVEQRWFQAVPVLSALVIVGVGVVMTGASIGVFKLAI
jgi:ABC-type nickel/cobalt efflux system permease component RcnA